MQKQQYTKTYESYNGRRYGKPWAAKITAFNGGATLEFVQYPYNGNDDGGEIVVECEVGEVVKIGQKDHRGNGTENDFYVAGEDGKLHYIDNAIEARKAWQAWQETKKL